MRTVFGIDVSKASSTVAVVVNKNKVDAFRIENNRSGFHKLLNSLHNFQMPEIVFEATGLYSRRLRTFLDDYGYQYTQLNPLASKKQLDRLRPNKTDKNDALNLAETQFQIDRALTYCQNPVYQQLLDWSRFYDNIVCDVVTDKNRLHKILQCTFPEVEHVLSIPSGHLYWHLLQQFPISTLVTNAKPTELINIIKKVPMVSQHHAVEVAGNLYRLAKEAYPCVDEHSAMVDQVRYLATELLRLDAKKSELINKMVALAQQLPELNILESIPGISANTAVRLIGELGDVRRFKSSNKLNAFVGIDLRHFESGKFMATDHISKRGDPYARKILYRTILNIMVAGKTHPTNIYDYIMRKKKQSPQTSGFKKIAIGAIHHLNRIIYRLIITNQKYSYHKALLKAK